MIRAMILDLDGTLVQTEQLKALSYAQAAVELCPREIDEAEVVEAFKEVVGQSRREVGQVLVDIAAQIASEVLGVPYERVDLVVGDTLRTLEGALPSLRARPLSRGTRCVSRLREAGKSWRGPSPKR